MNDIQLADEIRALLERRYDRSSYRGFAITPYDGVGRMFIVDFNPDLSEGFLVAVEKYEGV